ncbi:MAG: sigma-70 family RNA polymerase sigma factor, partial [Planctomycetota bacterium]
LSRVMGLPLKKINVILRAGRALHAPSQAPTDGDGEAMNFSDVLTDTRNDKPEETVFQRDELDTVYRLLDAIDEREARVLRLRFGLDGKEPLTLKEIGAEIGLTRERVRQIEVEALRKLNLRLKDDKPSRYFKGAAQRLEDEGEEAGATNGVQRFAG